jgi:hypothetical protein
MKFLGDIFSKHPNALTVSDWLLNIRDAFLKRAAIVIQKEPTSIDMIVLFTGITSMHSSNSVVHHDPSSVKKIGQVAAEYRIFYEAMWQFFLLSKYMGVENKQKIEKLYGLADIKFSKLFTSVFNDNPNIKTLLQDIIGRYYADNVVEGFKDYLYGERRYRFASSGDNLNDHIISLTLRVNNLLGSPPKFQKEFVSTNIHQIRKSLTLRFLTAFDLPNCTLLNMPSQFFEKMQ